MPGDESPAERDYTLADVFSIKTVFARYIDTVGNIQAGEIASRPGENEAPDLRGLQRLYEELGKLEQQLGEYRAAFAPELRSIRGARRSLEDLEYNLSTKVGAELGRVAREPQDSSHYEGASSGEGDGGETDDDLPF